MLVKIPTAVSWVTKSLGDLVNFSEDCSGKPTMVLSTTVTVNSVYINLQVDREGAEGDWVQGDSVHTGQRTWEGEYTLHTGGVVETSCKIWLVFALI